MLATLPYPDIGPLPIFGMELHLFGFLVAMAIIVGTIIAGRRAKQLGLSERVVADVAIWAVVGGFIMAHWYVAIFYPPKDPQEWYYIFKFWDGISSIGGFIGGATGAWLYFFIKKDLPFKPYADAIMYGFAFAWIFGRLGCTFAFDHPGSFTDFPLGMEYPTDRSVPGGPRHNLGMYEAIWAICISAFFYLNSKKPRFKGWYLSVFILAYAPFRFAIDFLRALDDRHLGLTGAQWGLIVLLGLVIWMVVIGMKSNDLLVPDGEPKHWPKKDMEALERSKTKSAKVGQSKKSKSKR
ncbi:MAG: phosphatidylglycerol:prolipoprotein diacylglycerol transferase [Myxococcota bacterium]|jgi:phosphatidylglycerol:prolipoprotein diacylglycerol transferase